jgi:hypothetical protein
LAYCYNYLNNIEDIDKVFDYGIKKYNSQNELLVELLISKKYYYSIRKKYKERIEIDKKILQLTKRRNVKNDIISSLSIAYKEIGDYTNAIKYKKIFRDKYARNKSQKEDINKSINKLEQKLKK